jgi:hypothetical protein
MPYIVIVIGEKIDLPVDEFGRVFNLAEIYCPGNDSDVYQENSNRFAMKFDSRLFDLNPGAMINGFLQSYKYFHPHAESHIKSLYSFPGIMLMCACILYHYLS